MFSLCFQFWRFYFYDFLDAHFIHNARFVGDVPVFFLQFLSWWNRLNFHVIHLICNKIGKLQKRTHFYKTIITVKIPETKFPMHESLTMKKHLNTTISSSHRDQIIKPTQKQTKYEYDTWSTFTVTKILWVWPRIGDKIHAIYVFSGIRAKNLLLDALCKFIDW